MTDHKDKLIERVEQGAGWKWLDGRTKPKLRGTDLQQRCANYLDWVFLGIYHIEEDVLRAVKNGQWDHSWLCSVNFHGGMQGGFATFDSDLLTTVVVGAHDFCLRVVVVPAGPQYLRLSMTARGRRGVFSEIHPTMEGHMASMPRIPEGSY